MKRREFLGSAAAFLWPARAVPVELWEVVLRQPPPHLRHAKWLQPGQDEFPEERAAMEIRAALQKAIFEGELPSLTAELADGWKRWRESLGEVTAARVFPLPGDRVRYEVASRSGTEYRYRAGFWHLKWRDGKLAGWKPESETAVSSPQRYFADVTAHCCADLPAFTQHLAHGIPYWRARLDAASGIDLYGNNGIAAGDIDGDGRDELYICQPGGLPNRLFRFDKNGSIEDLTESAGAGVLDDSTCALFLDLRNIGRQDLVLLLASGPQLFLNDGTGRFTAKPEAFRFGQPPQGSFTGMAAADYDRDGRVDLYLCCYSLFQSEAQYRYPVPYHDARNGPPNFLFRNRLSTDGTGGFEDVTNAVGLQQNNDRYSFAPAWCDYEGSGWPSLYVANDFGCNNLYRNRGGRFEDAAVEAGVEDMGPGMSASWFDFDGDGKTDLYVANMWSDAGQRVTGSPRFEAETPELKEAYRRHTKGNSLYRYEGDGRFSDAGARANVEMGRWAWAADGHDFNNDGSPELFITCGMLTNSSETDLMSYFWRQVVARSPREPKPSTAYEDGWNALNQFIREDFSWSGREPNVFYVRQGERFVDCSGVSGLDFADDSRAFAVTDIDGDGNLDLVLKSRLGPQVRVLQNRIAAIGNAIAFRLTGTKSNRDAIGARIEVDGQVKWVQAGSGYLSQHTKTVHFGLGTRQSADRVQITWPGGAVQILQSLSTGFLFSVTEGDENAPEGKRFAVRQPWPSPPPLPSDNTPRLHTTWLVEPVPLPEKHAGPALLAVVHGKAAGLPAGIPVQVVELSREEPERGALYSIFRRYLFDWRTDLHLPLLLLIDGEGRAARIYEDVPSTGQVQTDLEILRKGTGPGKALPFAGGVFSPPHRDSFKMGAAFLQAGYPEPALGYLQASLQRSPNNEKTLLAIAQIDAKAGRADQARKTLETVLQNNAESAAAWNELGGLAMDGGDVRTALTHYTRSLAADPNFTYALVNAAQAHVKLGEAEAAEPLFRKALQRTPVLADAANGLGLLFAQKGEFEEARRLFQQAITLQRDHASAINNLGVLYMQMGHADDALAAFRYGVDVAPDEEMLYLNLARTYVKAGQNMKARELMAQLLKRKPASETARKALRDLELP